MTGSESIRLLVGLVDGAVTETGHPAIKDLIERAYAAACEAEPDLGARQFDWWDVHGRPDVEFHLRITPEVDA